MRQNDRSQLFDDWAKDYDTAVAFAGAAFPFDGYEQVLDEVVRLADVRPRLRILDLGIGTGNLAARFVRESCTVWGVDFSAEMIAQARAKLPHVNLVQADLMEEWPVELQPPFDRVVSAYVMHEFDLAAKVDLLERVASKYLSPAGCILVADVAFPTVVARTLASRHWADKWDHGEHYWAADEAIAACGRVGLHVTYEQISGCGGVFAFTVKDVA
jgi:ubiquinone/menaquinone biosynthesis C-methylase UbiE